MTGGACKGIQLADGAFAIIGSLVFSGCEDSAILIDGQGKARIADASGATNNGAGITIQRGGSANMQAPTVTGAGGDIVLDGVAYTYVATGNGYIQSASLLP